MKRIYSESKSTIRANKIQRNEMCKCGSGKKAKYCCGAETTYFTFIKKLATSMLECSLLYIGEIKDKAFSLSLVTLRVDHNEYSLFDVTINGMNKTVMIKGLFLKKGITFKYKK